MNNIEKYEQIFIQAFNVAKEDLNENFTFAGRDDWDSMSHLNMVTLLEDEFGIMLDTEDILNYQSFENGKNILKKYGIEF